MTRFVRAQWQKLFGTAPKRPYRRPPVVLRVEGLEERANPVSKLPGSYSGTVAADWEFDQPGTYTITANLTINPSRTLRVGMTAAGTPVAGVNVVINPNATILVSGGDAKLDILSPASFAASDNKSFSTTGIVVNGGGSLIAANVNFSRLGGTNGNSVTRVQVLDGGKFTAAQSTFGWDRVQLDNGTLLPANSVTNTAFDTVLAVQAESVAALAGANGALNKRFADVEVNGTSGTTQNVTLAPLGAVTTNQRYLFPAAFQVGAGKSLNVAANAKVVINTGATVSVGGVGSGALNVTSPALFAVNDAKSLTTSGVRVGNGGSLSVTNAVFSRLDGLDGSSTSRVLVETGGTFAAAGSTFGWDRVQLDNDSILGSVTNSAFDTVLGLQAEFVPALAGSNGALNTRFQNVEINGGATQNPSLTLAPLGADPTNQQYVFPAAFRVTDTTTLNVAADAKVVINTGVTLTVGKGGAAFNVTSPALFAVNDAKSLTTSGVVVESGGSLNTITAIFSRLDGLDGSSTSRIQVAGGGAFTAAGSTFGWDRVQLDNGAVLSAGAVTSSAFDGVLGVQAESVAVFAGANGALNKRFQDVEINGTPAAGTTQNVTLAPLGATITDQRYVFAAAFKIGDGKALTVAANSKVVIPLGVTVTVGGGGAALNVTSPALFAAGEAKSLGSTNGIVVGTGGTLNATDAVFSRLDGVADTSVSRIQISSGGQLFARGGSFGWDQLTLSAGSKADIQFAFFDTSLLINSGADITGNAIRNNDFRSITGAASGTTGTTIDLTNNFWNTTVAAVIDARMTDKTENAALPQILFLPTLPGRSVLTTTTPIPQVPFNAAADQTVSLSAAFQSPSANGLADVNEGTATFRVFSGATLIGTAVTVNVATGAAGATSRPFKWSVMGAPAAKPGLSFFRSTMTEFPPAIRHF